MKLNHGSAAPDLTADSQVARIFARWRGFNALHLIDLGIRLGLFKAFAETPATTARSVAAQVR